MKIILWQNAMDILSETKIIGLLVATLFFLISLLFNLLQRRYAKARVDRMLEKDESFLNFLGVMDEYLGKLERTCTFELHGASSPKEVGKAIYVARGKIHSTVADMQEHLQSLRYRRRKEKKQKNQRKLLKQRPGAGRTRNQDNG